MFLFSFRGHTRFDTIQWVGAVVFGIVTFCLLQWPWQIVVPIWLLLWLPAVSRWQNGLDAKEAARQELLQQQLIEASKDGE